MPDYQKGKIYKIVSPHTDKIYIGSTTQPRLCQRLALHKGEFKNWQLGKVNRVTSFDLIELGDVEIILLESYPCNSKDELESRERYWYDLNKELIINKNRPFITEKERKQFFKEYREKNKETIKEYRKIKFNCECGSTNISYEHKKRHTESDKHQTYLMIQTL